MNTRAGRRFLDPRALARLANMQLVARTVVEGFVAGLHQSPHRGFSVEFAEYREYVPGDDLKHFDWRAFARCDRRCVKQYQEETNLRATVLLDGSRSMAYASAGGLSKFQYGCYLAATLLYLMVRQQDSVGLVLFDEAIRRRIPPRASLQHLREMLIVLEGAEPSSRTGIAGALHTMAEATTKRGLVVLISDLLEEPGEVLRGLKHFRYRRHEVLVLHVLDPAELELPFSGLSVFRDLETGEELVLDAHLYRSEYEAKVRALLERYRRACAERGIDYVLARTDEPFDRLLASYLAKRARLG